MAEVAVYVTASVAAAECPLESVAVTLRLFTPANNAMAAEVQFPDASTGNAIDPLPPRSFTHASDVRVPDGSEANPESVIDDVAVLYVDAEVGAVIETVGCKAGCAVIGVDR